MMSIDDILEWMQEEGLSDETVLHLSAGPVAWLDQAVYEGGRQSSVRKKRLTAAPLVKQTVKEFKQRASLISPDLRQRDLYLLREVTRDEDYDYYMDPITPTVLRSWLAPLSIEVDWVELKPVVSSILLSGEIKFMVPRRFYRSLSATQRLYYLKQLLGVEAYVVKDGSTGEKVDGYREELLRGWVEPKPDDQLDLPLDPPVDTPKEPDDPKDTPSREVILLDGFVESQDGLLDEQARPVLLDGFVPTFHD